MAIQAAHIGSFVYQAEASYGAGMPTTGQQEIPSDVLTSAGINPSVNAKRLPTINDYAYVDTIQGQRDLTINIEHQFQQVKPSTQHIITTCLEAYAITRSAGDMASIACYLKTGSGSYLHFKGAKVNTQTLNFQMNEAITVQTELWANSLVTAASAPGAGATAPSAIGVASYPIDTFNGSLCTRSGKWAAGIKSATLTINNNLERIPKIATGTAQGGEYGYIMPGIQDATINVEIIADAGGKSDIDDLLSDPETTIVLQTGSSTAKSVKYTLTKPDLIAEPFVYSADMTTLIISAQLGVETSAFAVV